MKHLIYISIMTLIALMAACKSEGEGRQGKCDVNVHMLTDEYSCGLLRDQRGQKIQDSIMRQGDMITFSRVDSAQMPYVVMLELLNPADTLDRIEVPIAIEAGTVDVEVGPQMCVKGTPNNQRLQRFMVEKAKLREKFSNMTSIDEVPKMKAAYSDFYAQQVIKNHDNVVGEFIYSAYKTHINEETRQKIDQMLNGSK